MMALWKHWRIIHSVMLTSILPRFSPKASSSVSATNICHLDCGCPSSAFGPCGGCPSPSETPFPHQRSQPPAAFRSLSESAKVSPIMPLRQSLLSFPGNLLLSFGSLLRYHFLRETLLLISSSRLVLPANLFQCPLCLFLSEHFHELQAYICLAFSLTCKFLDGKDYTFCGLL